MREIDNSTPMSSKVYDKEINNTIPYYGEFYEQVLDVVEQCGFPGIEWLDLGGGTGILEELAIQRFNDVKFVLVLCQDLVQVKMSELSCKR